jgi:protein-L-isoaspartate(D-aspartate) O-methyltransferase
MTEWPRPLKNGFLVNENNFCMVAKASPPNYKSQIAASFGSRADYDDAYTVRRATKLVELAQLKNGYSVLDIATGTALVAIAAARSVGPKGHVIGVDISEGMLDQARTKIRATGLQNIELMHADIERVTFAAESFDAIMCSSAFMWLTDISAALRDCRVWLKTGGLLAFSCYSESSFMAPLLVKACARFGINLPNCNEPLGTHERCRDLLQAAGFANIEIQTEQLGSHLSRNDPWWQWDGEANWLDPRGNPLAELSEEQLSEIRLAYEEEVDALATDQGYWHEITMFLVSARK